jgi:hypothetical protein
VRSSTPFGNSASAAGYANFASAEPPLKLVLIEGKPCKPFTD